MSETTHDQKLLVRAKHLKNWWWGVGVGGVGGNKGQYTYHSFFFPSIPTFVSLFLFFFFLIFFLLASFWSGKCPKGCDSQYVDDVSRSKWRIWSNVDDVSGLKWRIWSNVNDVSSPKW